MKKQYLILLMCLLQALPLLAQKPVKGTVKDGAGKAIESASINLKDAEGNSLGFTRSNDKGEFSLVPKSGTPASLEVSCIGYQKKTFALTETNALVLEQSAIALKDVSVKGKPQLGVNGDTLNYRTGDFAEKQDRTIGDALKRMPGIEVAENGKISYNGKSISNLYIDGDNVLNDKYNIGTKSIPVDAVDKVQVIENDQPLKMLRKNSVSDDVALNLVLKDEARMKLMGDIKAGAGMPERFDGNITGMMFNKNLKFVNGLKGNNIGIDPGQDLISHNLSDFLRRIDNSKPESFLSVGAAGVPSLPQTRSLWNKAGLINLNNLKKFNDEWLFRANVSYLYDDRRQDYNRFSETYLPGNTIRYSEVQDNSMNPQRFKSQFTLNGNAENYFFNNTTVVDYSTEKTRSAFSINNIGGIQTLQQETFDLSNELNYRQKLKSGHTINLYNFLNRTTQPETLDISPGLNEGIFNGGMPYAGLNQFIKLPTLYMNSYGAFALVNGKFTQTYKLGHSLQSQDLNTSLFRTQNDQTNELVATDAVNRLDWTKSKLYFEPSYEYSSDKLKASVNLPLSYNHIKYADAGQQLNDGLTRYFLNPAVNLKYQVGRENSINLNYGLRNDLGNIADIYQGSILRNYRSLFANDAPITERQTNSVGGQFSYRKAMKMIFANLQANYSTTELNTISSFTLTNNIQQRIVLPLPNKINNLALALNASKYLFKLSSTVSAGVSYNQMDYNQLQNSALLPYQSQTMNYKAGIESKLTKFINWSYNANYQVTENEAKAANAINTNFKQLRQTSALTVTMFKSLFLNVSAEHMLTMQSNQPDLDYLFADMNIRYRIPKYKTDIEFGITNLANVHTFQAISLNANSYSAGSYSIPGRVGMLRATFNF